MPLYKAGSDIDAWCTKCKMMLAHVIIAMKGPKPARVECKTCRSVHAYKSASPGTPAARKKTATETGPRLSDFDKLVQGKDISKAERYAPTTIFEEEQVVDHKQFGIGIVTRSLSDKKIEVVFKDATRVLVHSR
jgi:hypothetical protein